MPLLFISDFVSSRISTQLTRSLTERLVNRQRELGSGRRPDIAEFNNGRIGDVQRLQKEIADLDRLREGISLANTELDVVQLSLGTINDTVGDIGVRVASAAGVGEQQTLRIASEEARGAIDGIFTALNARANGRYVFSGDAVNQPPLASSDVLFTDLQNLASAASDPADLTSRLDQYFSDPAGGFSQNIYQGSDAPVGAYAVGSTERIGNAVTATDPSLRGILFGLASVFLVDQAFELFPGEQTIEFASNAAGNLNAGRTELTQTEASVGVDQARLDVLSARYRAEEVILTRSFNDRTARDPATVATELRELEARLETSFLVTARLAELRLTNFLR